MSGREWIPGEWLDEIVPKMQPTPEAWAELHEGRWRLVPPVGDLDRDNEFYLIDVEPGQVVEFVYREKYGTFVVTVREDRTWSANGTWPENATHFWRDGEIFDSMEEAVNPLDMAWSAEPLEPGEHEIDVGFWSEGVQFRFDINADGKPIFTIVAGPN